MGVNLPLACDFRICHNSGNRFLNGAGVSAVGFMPGGRSVDKTSERAITTDESYDFGRGDDGGGNVCPGVHDLRGGQKGKFHRSRDRGA